MKKYLKEIKGLIILSNLFFIIETLITSTMLLLPGYLIDQHQITKGNIIKLCLIYMLLFSLYLIVCFISNRLADKRRIKFEKSIKQDFFSAVLERKYEDYYFYETGEYISMQGNDITEMCQNYLSPLISIFRSIIMILIFGIALIIYVDFTITLMIIMCSILAVFVPKITAKELSGRNHKYLDAFGKYTTKISSFFQLYPILDKRSKNKVKEVHAKELTTVLKENMHFRKLNSLAFVFNGGAAEFVGVITFIIVAVFLWKENITIGMATIAFMYSNRFIEPISELNLNIGRIKSVEQIKHKLMQILQYKNREEGKKINSFNEIIVDRVEKNFEHSTVVLPHMILKKSEKYLVIGDNGTGKSVFLKMLMKYYPMNKGTIFFDSTDIRKIDVSNQFAYVAQNSVILETSYYNNITLYGTYSDKNLALYESFFPEHIIEKIKKSSSIMNLSGGEKQIVSIIRSLCMEKQIILWDEPFSAMNKKTIDTFVEHISEIPQTLILIAHNFDDYTKFFSKVYSIK